MPPYAWAMRLAAYMSVWLTVTELGMFLFANGCIGHTGPQRHRINLSIRYLWNPDESAGVCFHLASLHYCSDVE